MKDRNWAVLRISITETLKIIPQGTAPQMIQQQHSLSLPDVAEYNHKSQTLIQPSLKLKQTIVEMMIGETYVLLT